MIVGSEFSMDIANNHLNDNQNIFPNQIFDAYPRY
jgi:hypothetical protein